jgi:1-acyl-sn-glycerol-3-phosphate acyltransferase
MIRTVFITLYVIAATCVLGTLTIVTSLFSTTGDAPHLVARCWARSILAVGRIRVTVKGLAHIDPRRPCIYMPNHASLFDIPVILGYLPVQFRWLAKAELFKIPVFGLAMRRVGYISIDRSNRKSAFRSLKTAAETIRNGASVVIFPEGTRSREASIGPFKMGGFVLAVDAGVPVVPVILHGTRQIMSQTRFRIKSGAVSMEITPPIDSSSYTRKTKDDLMATVREVITAAYREGQPTASTC